MLETTALKFAPVFAKLFLILSEVRDLRDGTVVPLFKKGDRHQCTSFLDVYYSLEFMVRSIDIFSALTSTMFRATSNAVFVSVASVIHKFLPLYKKQPQAKSQMPFYYTTASNALIKFLRVVCSPDTVFVAISLNKSGLTNTLVSTSLTTWGENIGNINNSQVLRCLPARPWSYFTLNMQSQFKTHTKERKTLQRPRTDSLFFSRFVVYEYCAKEP